MSGSNRLTITVPEDLKNEAKIKAIRKGTSVSEVLREFLARWVKENDKEDKH